MATLSVRMIAQECLGITERISIANDVLTVSDGPPGRSTRSALAHIRRTRCKPNAPTRLDITSKPPLTSVVGLVWDDNSDNEDGFRVRFRGTRAGFPDHDDTHLVDGSVKSFTQTVLRTLLAGFEYTIDVTAFNAAGDSSPSNQVHVALAAVEETRRVLMQPQPIIEGPIPFLGEFVSPASGRLLRIRFPGSGGGEALAFVKRGRSSDECTDSNAVVPLRQGDTTTPAQMTAIFDDPEPRLEATRSFFFLACLQSPLPLPPIQVREIEIDVIFE